MTYLRLVWLVQHNAMRPGPLLGARKGFGGKSYRLGLRSGALLVHQRYGEDGGHRRDDHGPTGAGGPAECQPREQHERGWHRGDEVAHVKGVGV